jgi:hypothetical protein
MRHSFYAIICLFFSTFCFSQTITLKGSVQDSQGIPLESATVYLTSVKDSSVVDYTITNKNGNWELKTRKLTEPVLFRISFISTVEHKQEFQSITEDKDFGLIKLQDKPNELDALVIESEIPPIRIKSDTLEFNASSFKVRPDANVEALLKQLPGVEIDSEGKITVNGKEVNEILVNGKPFFDKTGKIALQNLPAEMIDKVQVSDTKTEAEKVSGQAATGNESSINLTIQKDKNKGLFGKFMGGYGSDKRYESSGLLNYFKDKRRISILGSSNNINSVGFSMDEIFDNMGAGRNSVWISSDGSYSVGGNYFGANRGITRTNMLGLNYSDEWGKDFDAGASYFLSATNTENNNRTRRETLLPVEEDTNNPGTFINNNFVTESRSRTESDQFSHNFNGEFRMKPDSTSTLSFQPKLTQGHMKSTSTDSQLSLDENGELLNESSGSGYNETDNTGFENRLYYYKAFKNKKRAVSVSFNNNNEKKDAEFYTLSSTTFYEDEDDDGIPETTVDNRDQVQYSRQIDDQYELGVEYFEPVLDSTRLKIAVGYKAERSVEDKEGYNYDVVTGDYTALNDLITNYLSSSTKTVTPTAGFTIDKSKFNLSVDLGTSISSFNNFGTYLGNNYTVNKNYLLPSADAYIQYRLGKAKSIYINYSFYTNFPQARQVLPIEDISNPLYTFVGNPDLDPTKQHSLHFSFRDFDFATRSGYSIWAGFNVYDDRIVDNTLINESAKRTTTYANLSGMVNMYSSFNWNKTFKKEAHTFRVNARLSANIGKQKGFTNGELYEALDYGIEPKLSLTYDYGELLSIAPSYSFDYSEQDYKNYAIGSTSTVVHKLTLQTTSYWPKHVVFGNDFGYTYNSNIADGFKKDFFLWNASLGYNFLNDKLLAKVKVYDLLNQNIGTSRTITSTSIIDQENLVLKRYVMFSLTFKLEKFGAKEKKESNRFWMW